MAGIRSGVWKFGLRKGCWNRDKGDSLSGNGSKGSEQALRHSITALDSAKANHSN